MVIPIVTEVPLYATAAADGDDLAAQAPSKPAPKPTTQRPAAA